MIESLTAEQEAQIPGWVEKWKSIGLSTGQDADYEACFQAVKSLYANEGDITGYQVVDSPMGIYDICKDSQFLSKSFFGSFECGWLSYYTFFKEVVGVSLNREIDYFVTLASNVAMVYIHGNIAIFCKRPVEIHTQNDQLHNESGPAVKFNDGFSVWSIRGNRVTEQIVMRPETLTVKQINSETNSDIQSIMLDRFGWARYINESEAKLIDSRHNDIENTLEALYDTEKFGLRIVLTCPTGRVFVKGVSSDLSPRTCEAAQGWLSGSRPKFRTIART